MDKVRISVIMPVYNAERYLGETLQSLRKQTYKDFEILCINDASTDASLEILQKFQHMDERLRILENREHSGAAFSRNQGICEAKGEYITFLDGDDIFEEEMLDVACNTMKRHNVDIVMYEMKHISGVHIYEKQSILRSDRFIEKYCEVPFSIRECEPIVFLNWTDSPCNKLYRKSFIVNNRLTFQTLPSANDMYFVNMAMLLAKKVIMLNDRRVMIYARDHDAATRISCNRDPMCVYKALEAIGEELVARDIFPMVFQHYYFRLFYALRNTFHRIQDDEKANDFYRFLQREGVDRLTKLSSDCYGKVDNYIYKLIENYKRLDYSSEWYKRESIFVYYLNRNAQKVISLFQSYKDNSTEVALWGVGINGRELLSFLGNYNLKVSEVVDKDEKKQGAILEEYKIRCPEEIVGKVQVVVVCSFPVYREVMAELEGTGTEVVDIELIIQEVGVKR